jgi:hypothetical protein
VASYNSHLADKVKTDVLNTFESCLVVILMVAGSLAFLLLVHHLWPTDQRQPHNDLIGWQITVLGTTYAVVIGFMLYAVWTTFQLASENAEAEANSLVNVVRSAQGLPDAQRQQIQDLGKEYVNLMLTQEWPAMNRVIVSHESDRAVRQLWAVITKTETRNSTEQTSRDHAFSELSQMTEHRRFRQLQVVSALPGILWAVLIAGAIVTIVSACLFGGADLKLHFVQVGALALMVSLVLVAIADINRPFQGSVHVPPIGFERAQATLAQMK